MGDREIAESFWLQNEVAVNRLYAASDHERELNAAKSSGTKSSSI